jgi:formamidopyrimidine-DNA glycosylase
MPEGPEAYTMANFLATMLIGKYIIDIKVLDERHSKGGIETIGTVALIKDVTAYGKRPIFVTDIGYFVTFLCMNGRWLLKPANHTRLVFEIGTCDFTHEITTIYHSFNIYFDDQRSQGLAYVQWMKDDFELNAYKSSVGPDLLRNPPFPTVSFVKEIARKRFKPTTTLDVFLLSPVSNCTVGNYLKSEILYRAGLDPRRTLEMCSDEQLEILYICAVEISRESLKYQGFTMKDYLKPDGSHGSFVCKVYGKEGKLDPNGYLIHRIKGKDNRSTYFVPETQT